MTPLHRAGPSAWARARKDKHRVSPQRALAIAAAVLLIPVAGTWLLAQTPLLSGSPSQRAGDPAVIALTTFQAQQGDPPSTRTTVFTPPVRVLILDDGTQEASATSPVDGTCYVVLVPANPDRYLEGVTVSPASECQP